MPINTDKMKQERAARQFSSELLEVKEGETQMYVCAPSRPAEEVPYVEVRMHYGLGKKAKFSHMCLEPSENPVLNNPEFQAALEAIGKNLSGGCETCRRLDGGLWVSGDPEQSGKGSGRWLWIVVPIAFRSDSRQNFSLWNTEEVKGFFVGYGVWDKLMDQFGSMGDITNMDQAVFIRAIREGTLIKTKWDIQADIDSVRKPVKLKPTLRKLIMEKTAPGGDCDPYKILAGLSRTPEDIAKNFVETTAAQGEYETGGEEQPPADTGDKFKPPGKGNNTGTKPPAAGATKSVATKSASTPAVKGKDAPAPAASNGVPKASAQLKVLIAANGQPPLCFQIDPDANADICISCPFQDPCFTHCGVPKPDAAAPDEVPADAEPADDADAGILVENCEMGTTYLVNGGPAEFKGQAKGMFYFTGADGKPQKLPPESMVGLIQEDAAEPDDDSKAKLDKLEAELKARKGKAAAKK